MAKRLQIRRDSTANWSSNNPTLAEGEIAWDTTLEKGKVGDGSTAWSSLPFSIFTQAELDAKAPLSSPGLIGVPTAPTASEDTATTQIATTEFVVDQGYLKSVSASSIYSPIVSPGFTGTPTAPTASADTATTQIATTEFVVNQDYIKSASAASLYLSKSAASATYASTSSPTFIGTVTTPQLSVSDGLIVVQRVSSVNEGGEIQLYRSSDNTPGWTIDTYGSTSTPSLRFFDSTNTVRFSIDGSGNAQMTGAPTAPTAAAGTNNTQIATTAFVTTAVASSGGGGASLPSQTGYAGALLGTDGTNASWNTSFYAADANRNSGFTAAAASGKIEAVHTGNGTSATFTAYANGNVNLTNSGNTVISTTGTISASSSNAVSLSTSADIDLRSTESTAYFGRFDSGLGGYASYVSANDTTLELNAPSGSGGTITSNAETTILGAYEDPLSQVSIFAPLLKASKEYVNVSATAAASTVNFNVAQGSVLYYTTAATGNWTLNIRGDASTTLNQFLRNTGNSVTVAFLATQGSTAYYQTSLTINGVSQTVKWMSGLAPSAGNSNSIDLYSFTIIKTGTSTYTVLGQMTKFA